MSVLENFNESMNAITTRLSTSTAISSRQLLLTERFVSFQIFKEQSSFNETDKCEHQSTSRGFLASLYKGGDPAAPSGTATLLRLHPPHPPHLRRLPPCGWAGDFGCRRLGWCDGRCVQGPGTYSPRHADPRLLAIPTSCRRVAAYNPNWDGFWGFALPRGFASLC